MRLDFKPRALFWRNLIGAYCVGLDQFAPISVVACSDHGLDLDLIQQHTGIRFYALEENTSKRIAPVGHQQESEAEGAIVRVLQRLSKEKYAIASPVPSRLLDDFVNETGFPSASTPFHIANWLGEKKNWFTGLDELKLPRLKGRWLRLNAMSFSEMRSEFGGAFVAQLSRGVSGSGTAVIRSAAEYAQALERLGDEPAWVAPFLGGPSLAINAVALETGTAVGYPSVQIVGCQECNALPGSYCGNDYSASRALPRTLIEDVQTQTERIGRWIATLGFRGIFGLDFGLDEELRAAYALDLNPRWLGSTALFCQAEERAGRIPLAALDLGARLGALSEEEALKIGDHSREPVAASQVILYAAGTEWCEVTQAPSAGVFRFENGQMQFRNEGIRLADCTSDEDFLITCGVPRVGLQIEPRSHLLRMYRRGSVLNGNWELAPRCCEAAGCLYDAIEWRSAEVSNCEAAQG